MKKIETSDITSQINLLAVIIDEEKEVRVLYSHECSKLSKYSWFSSSIIYAISEEEHQDIVKLGLLRHSQNLVNSVLDMNLLNSLELKYAEYIPKDYKIG